MAQPDASSAASRQADFQTLEREVHRLRSAIEELTVLNDLAIAASSSLEVDEMLDIIVQKAIKATNAEQGSILLVTEQGDKPLKTLIRQAERSSRLSAYKLGESITGWVLKYRKPLIIENLATDPRFSPTEHEKKEIRSVLCVPIVLKGKLIGVITLTNKHTAPGFNENDLRLLAIIAAQSGQLIRNKQLQEEALEKQRLQHELQMAHKIQMSLLPEATPAFSRLQVANYFNPADEISGDYFDYFLPGGNRLGIVLADVSGHGTSSALVMTMVKGMLQVMKPDLHRPSRILGSLNASLAGLLPRDMFVTMVLGIFDLDQMTLRVANAGHNPILRCSGTPPQCEFLQFPGAALSILANAEYQDHDLALQSGDSFFLYTDGLTEAFNERGEMFEESRLMKSLEKAAAGTAEHIIDHVRREFLTFIGDLPQGDDVAMIAVKLD